MAENPLIGKTISLISKKNIRYLGTLYSINEQNATVALQNVKSYGTEGREEDGRLVAPSDAVHPFLLFRGQDIKDLHVHEEAAASTPEAEPAQSAAPTAGPDTTTENSVQESAQPKVSETQQTAKTEEAPPEKEKTQRKPKEAAKASEKPAVPAPKQSAPAPAAPPRTAAQVVAGTSGQAKTPRQSTTSSAPQQQQQQQGGRGRGRGRGNNNRKPAAAPGTGASLLNRTARGTNSTEDTTNFKQDFDFQSNLEEFQKENTENPVQENDDGGDVPVDDEGLSSAYDKDDFFDSISSDATDRANGIDNRLRGKQERTLNTETFGAVALNHSDNYRRRGGRGRGRGGRGRGRGRGGRGYRGGRGRGGRGYRGGRSNNSGINASGTTAAAS